MHEVSLIQNLLDIIIKNAEKNNIKTVNKIKLVIGESHGALPEALNFAFKVLTENTICEGATLEIEKTPVYLRCKECFGKYKPEDIYYKCPFCNSVIVEQTNGRELYVDYYEGD